MKNLSNYKSISLSRILKGNRNIIINRNNNNLSSKKYYKYYKKVRL